MLNRTAIGRTTDPRLNEVERGAVKRFAEAVGEQSPWCLDASAARAMGYSSVVAPLGFACALEAGEDLRGALGVPLRQLVLSEVSLENERMLVAGDKVLVTAKVAEVGERQSPAGSVEYAVIEDEGRDEAGRFVYRLRRTYVRSKRDT